MGNSIEREGADVVIKEPFSLRNSWKGPVPSILADGKQVKLIVMDFTIDYEVERVGWNYPDAGNTYREETEVSDAEVSIAETGIIVEMENGEWFSMEDSSSDVEPLPSEVWELIVAHATDHFPIDSFHDAIREHHAEHGGNEDYDDYDD
jgi:hypothetical protein